MNFLDTHQTLEEIMSFKFRRRIIQSNIERVDTLKTFHSPHGKNRIFVRAPDLQKRKTLTHEEMKTQQEVARSKLHKENISKSQARLLRHASIVINRAVL